MQFTYQGDVIDSESDSLNFIGQTQEYIFFQDRKESHEFETKIFKRKEIKQIVFKDNWGQVSIEFKKSANEAIQELLKAINIFNW